MALAPEQSPEEAFDRLAPLFRQTGTSHERANDTLTFSKEHQAAQDKMSIFDGGVLRIRESATGLVLHYQMSSRALLFCFLAPLLFVGFAQLTIFIGKLEQPSAETGKGRKHTDGAKKAEKAKAGLPQNWIDKALGSPAPEKSKKKAKGGSDEDDEKPSPTSAYVFAALFAVLYFVGRILEDVMVKALFKKNLQGL